MELDTNGVTLLDKSRELKIGPFPSLAEISSLEVGHNFGIPPKRVLAFILQLSRGIPTSYNNEMKEEEKENPRRNIKAKPRAPWL